MKVELKGINRNTPGAICPDGELEELLNLRHKDGAFRAVPNRSAILTDLAYSNVYVHSNSGYKHFLGIREDEAVLKLYYFAKDIDGIATKIAETYVCTITDSSTFTQIGNVININDSQGLKYAIWYDSAYKYIDSNFDGTQTVNANPVGRVDIRVTGGLGKTGKRDFRLFKSDVTFGYGNTGDADATDARQLRADSANGLMAKAISSLEKDGKLTGFFLACSAIELYDGSYILQSNPVLCGEEWDVASRYSALAIDGNTFDYTNKQAIFYPKCVGDGVNIGQERLHVQDGKILSGVKPNDDDSFTAELDLTSAFVPGSTNLVSVESQNMPNLMGYYDKRYNSSNGVAAMPVWMFSSYNKLQFRIHQSIDPSLEPLIKSVSIFITTAVQLYKVSGKSHWIEQSRYENSSSYNYCIENFLPILKTSEELKTEIGDLRTFYKVKTIDYSDIIAADWIDVDLTKGILQNITAQEVLPYDNFSHHSTLPKIQFVYNSKLHIGNYKTSYSRGRFLDDFYAQQGTGQFPTEMINPNGSGWIIKTEIKTTNGISTVVRFKQAVLGSDQTPNMLAAMLSYPDSRATKMTITKAINTDMGWYSYTKEYKLTAHDTQNYAYYLSDDLKPIANAYPDSSTIPLTIPAEGNREQSFSNICKVSEVNNPFIFPIENTYPIGNGELEKFATNTIALSTGQSGEHPLYIFHSEGIDALYIGGAEVNYSSSRPISREVCNNPLSVKPIDNGVIFTTEKGVMIISGSQVADLSEVLRGDYFDLSKTALFQKAINHKSLVRLSTEITTEGILDYIKTAIVGYKYVDKEVWFTNPSKTYSYVFSKGIWHKVKQTGQLFVNDYPNQYLLSSGSLIDIGSEHGTANETMFLTRPLKLGDQNFKQMVTAVVRGFIKTENAFKVVNNVTVLDYKRYAGIYIFGSYDCQRWQFLGGSEKTGELRDLGAKVERTDCKFFRIGFVGNITLDSTIDYIEIEGKESILNKKLR